LRIEDEKKTINSCREEISTDQPVKFSSLTLEDIPQISNLLMSVWPVNYGTMGFPKFDQDYLNWVFGGPNRDRHILFGGKIQNELVAYYSLLYRRIHYSGYLFDGYIGTHMTILPHLSSQERFNCLLQMLYNIEKSYLSANCDFIYEFSEEKKLFRDVLRNFVERYTKVHVEDAYRFSFSQFFVQGEELLKYCGENVEAIDELQVRDALEKDYGAITNLFNNASSAKGEFTRQMTESELRHHFCGHAAHRTAVIEIHGVIQGFNNYYPLEIIKDGKARKYIIIEYLILDHINSNYMTALLKETVNYAIQIGAKGVVIENATYLDLNTYRELGVKPTFRKMVMEIYSKNNVISNLDGFRCDVK